MAKTKSGFFVPKNKEKYTGRMNTIEYRSGWEQRTMTWIDQNPDVVAWNSEEIVIPYICKTDNSMHRYFIDFYIKFKSGTEAIIEVKPKFQCVPPKITKGKRKKTMINEALQWAKNTSKWDAAEKYANKRGWKFWIWTEDTLNTFDIVTK